MVDFYDVKTFNPDDALGPLLGQVGRALIERIDREVAPLDLTAQQAIVLAKLQHSGMSHAADFCKTTASDPAAFSRLIDRLESKGFVRRTRNPDDRRAVKIDLTERGLAALPKIRAASTRVFNHFLRDFTKTEARQLIDLLKRLVKAA